MPFGKFFTNFLSGLVPWKVKVVKDALSGENVLSRDYTSNLLKRRATTIVAGKVVAGAAAAGSLFGGMGFAADAGTPEAQLQENNCNAVSQLVEGNHLAMRETLLGSGRVILESTKTTARKVADDPLTGVGMAAGQIGESALEATRNYAATRGLVGLAIALPGAALGTGRALAGAARSAKDYRTSTDCHRHEGAGVSNSAPPFSPPSPPKTLVTALPIGSCKPTGGRAH